MSTNVRFMDNQQTSMLPGPGAYKQPTLSKINRLIISKADTIHNKTWGKQGVFGSTEKRFV